MTIAAEVAVAVSPDDDWDDDEYLVQRMEWIHAAKKRQIFKDYSNGRDANDEVQCKSLEQKNIYLASLYDDEGPCQYTEYQQYQRLIVFWLRCVQQDEVYGDFCDALKLDPAIGNTPEATPETAFMREFYEDWGDVRRVDNEMEWIRSKFYLFMPAWIQAVEPGSVVPAGVMATSVPQGVFKAEHLDRMFAAVVEQAKSTRSTAKYEISKLRGESFADTAQRLHIASYVHQQFTFWNDSVRDVTRKFRSEWELFEGMQGTDFESVATAQDLEAYVESCRRTVRRWKETYELCKMNAIARNFPPRHTNTK